MLKNWKTTAAGAVAIVGAIPSVAPYIPVVNQVIDADPQTKGEFLAAAIIALSSGLLVAKDGDVTGGSRTNAK